MKFSICVPNFNYGRYLGRTLESVLAQAHGDFEILVSDNASTDNSVAVVKSFVDPRVRLKINACNVGFAGNLDRAAAMAGGDLMMMLSSDDMMRPEALAVYDAFYRALDEGDARRAVVSATTEIIDPRDVVIGRIPPDPEVYRPEDRVFGLPVPPGATVYRVEGDELLRRCIRMMRNPFNFLATVYPRAIYQRVEGYGAGRLVNPDKWFHWKLLGAGTVAYFIDHPLFAYRTHPSNQTAQQAASGALKYLADEYISTFEVDKTQLERLGLTREILERAFIERDIARHGLATLGRGQPEKARRIFHFGRAAYPALSRTNPMMWALGVLLALGPIGSALAKKALAVRDTIRATP